MAALKLALSLLLLPLAEAGRRPVGSVGALFSEGILTWDDVLGLDSSATLHVSGKLGTACGDLAGQALCALQSVESTFALGFGIPVEEFPMAFATECRVYLVDMADYAALNAVYTDFFASTPTTPPVRLCLSVDELPVGGLVEVQCSGHYDGPWAVHHGLNATTTLLSAAAGTAPVAVDAWLAAINMEQYTEGFASAGWDDLEVIASGMSEAELKSAGVEKPGHVKKLQQRIAALPTAAPTTATLKLKMDDEDGRGTPMKVPAPRCHPTPSIYCS